MTFPDADVLVWVHGDCLSPEGPALSAYPGAPALWVWDDELLNEWAISFKRIVFIYECLLELPVEIRRGQVVSEILRYAREQNARHIVTAESPSPRFTRIVRELRRSLPVDVLPVAPLVDYGGDLDLQRFSRYWRRAEAYAMKRGFGPIT